MEAVNPWDHNLTVSGGVWEPYWSRHHVEGAIQKEWDFGPPIKTGELLPPDYFGLFLKGFAKSFYEAVDHRLTTIPPDGTIGHHEEKAQEEVP